MRTAWRVASGVVLVGAAMVAAVEITRHQTQAEIRAAAGGFSGERAFNDLKELVKLGPRPPGSRALEEARQYITRGLSAAGAAVRMDSFVAKTPIGKIPMSNVIGAFHGESPGIVMVAGHYETAKLDRVSFVGANDGGSSAAFLLELARVLGRRRNKLTYWVVFFDGEEALRQWSAGDSLYGSRHLAEKLAAEGELDRIKALILVDMVADCHLSILRELNSTPWLSDMVQSGARQLGYERSFRGGAFAIEDDHLSFLRYGVPAVDIIDLTPLKSYHHTSQDTIDKCSPRSLEVVGRVVLGTLGQLERIK